MSAPNEAHTLSRDEHNLAWLRLYQLNLDELPDREIAWERDQWHRLGLPALVTACDGLLHERQETDTPIHGGASARDLDQLVHAVDLAAAGKLIEREAMSLVEAIRVVYWTTLRERPR